MEFKKGWVSEPTAFSMSDFTGAVVAPRFRIAARRGVQEPKFRIIGLVNSNVENSTDVRDILPARTGFLRGVNSNSTTRRLGRAETMVSRLLARLLNYRAPPPSMEKAQISCLDSRDNSPYK